LTQTFSYKFCSQIQKKKEECKLFLNQLKDGKQKGVVTDFTIHSIIVIMGSLNKIDELKTFLLSLTTYEGLAIHDTRISEEINAATIAIQENLDMDDAIQYSVAISTKVETIVSFDKHFNKLKIPRKEPHQLT
jgi:predicted nucleic acid-binding protein